MGCPLRGWDDPPKPIKSYSFTLIGELVEDYIWLTDYHIPPSDRGKSGMNPLILDVFRRFSAAEVRKQKREDEKRNRQHALNDLRRRMGITS